MVFHKYTTQNYIYFFPTSRITFVFNQNVKVLEYDHKFRYDISLYFNSDKNMKLII